MKYTITILFLITVIGCADPEVASPEVETTDKQVQVSNLSPSWVKSEHATDLQTRSELGGNATLVFFGALEEHGRENWKTIDTIIREYRDQIDPEYRYLVDQDLSQKMLLLLDEVCVDDCDAARAYHVERLIDAGYPDAAVLESNLGHLKDYWSSEQLKKAGHQSAENAEVWLARQQQIGAKREDCEDCEVYADAQEIATRRIVEATRRLQTQK